MRSASRAAAALLAVGLSQGIVFAESPPLALADLAAARKRHPAELEAEARIATSLRRLAGSQGVLLGGATLSAAAGPRRGEGGDASTDVALGLDLPLLFAREEQRALAAAIEAAAPVLRSAARATAELELELAYLDAWRDAELAALRETELGIVFAWLAAVERRVEAGAEAPYEAVAVAGEVTRATLERDAARAAAIASHASLAARVELPLEGRALAGPGAAPPAPPPAEGDGALRLAIRLGAELVAAEARLEAASGVARWSLATELAREGEEEVARLGLAYRIAPRGERPRAEAESAATAAALERRSSVERAALEARAAAAASRLAAPASSFGSETVARALAALEARIVEGKERPSAVLPQRRALVDAEVAAIEGRHARAAARAELVSLTRGVEP